jgi:hypothetical protein
MRWVRTPQPKVADASTANVALFLEALEREMHRPLRAGDAPYQFAGVELLAGSPGQEREQTDLGRATPKAGGAADCLHVLDVNTIVLVSETSSYQWFRTKRARHAAGELAAELLRHPRARRREALDMETGLDAEAVAHPDQVLRRQVAGSHLRER